jgi:hypothetical protein
MPVLPTMGFLQVERLEREKNTAQVNLQMCRLSLKEKDKNREDNRPGENEGDDVRLGKATEGAPNSSSVGSSSAPSSRAKRLLVAADAQQQQQQQLQAEKSALEAEREQLRLLVEESQESLRGAEQEKSSLRARVLTLEEARSRCDDHC